MYSELYVKILGTAEFQLRPGNLLDNIFVTLVMARDKIFKQFLKHIYDINKPCDEVLGAAQFTEQTMHNCQKLSKVVKSCHKLS